MFDSRFIWWQMCIVFSLLTWFSQSSLYPKVMFEGGKWWLPKTPKRLCNIGNQFWGSEKPIVLNMQKLQVMRATVWTHGCRGIWRWIPSIQADKVGIVTTALRIRYHQFPLSRTVQCQRRPVGSHEIVQLCVFGFVSLTENETPGRRFVSST